MRLATLPLLLLIAALASCGGSDGDSRFTAAVIGDVPYGTSPTDTAEFLAFPAFIKSVNDDRDVTLVLHAGDIHSGKQYCTQAYNASIFEQLKTLVAPLVYTPGDNEWADCHDPAFPADGKYVENVWFTRSGVLFVAANIPGGSNNGTDSWYGAPARSAAQDQEVAARTGATAFGPFGWQRIIR